MRPRTCSGRRPAGGHVITFLSHRLVGEWAGQGHLRSRSAPPLPSVDLLSSRALRRRARLRVGSRSLGLVILLCAGLATGTTYIAILGTSSSGVLTGGENNVSGGTCGFVSLGSTNVVGTGSQSGSNYISFIPALSSSTVTQSVTATINQFNTGTLGYEYLIDEVGFGCTSASAGAVVHFILGATASTSNARWVVMEISFDKNSPSTSPLAGTPCDQSGGGLFLPFGATRSTWGTTNYTGGDTYTFSANQTGGAHLTDDSCTANADPSHTSLPDLVIGATITGLQIFYYVSFVVTGASQSTPITNPAFSLSFN